MTHTQTPAVTRVKCPILAFFGTRSDIAGQKDLGLLKSSVERIPGSPKLETATIVRAGDGTPRSTRARARHSDFRFAAASVARTINTASLSTFVGSDQILDRRNVDANRAVARFGTSPRRFAPLCRAATQRTDGIRLGYRPARRQRPPGGTRALARHRPQALHRRPCLRRNSTPAQLFARLRADPDRMFRSFADLLGVDHQRVRLWT
jgi:hypothetical protein